MLTHKCDWCGRTFVVEPPHDKPVVFISRKDWEAGGVPMDLCGVCTEALEKFVLDGTNMSEEAHWAATNHTNVFQCSSCNSVSTGTKRYCGNCGKRMSKFVNCRVRPGVSEDGDCNY